MASMYPFYRNSIKLQILLSKYVPFVFVLFSSVITADLIKLRIYHSLSVSHGMSRPNLFLNHKLWQNWAFCKACPRGAGLKTTKCSKTSLNLKSNIRFWTPYNTNHIYFVDISIEFGVWDNFVSSAREWRQKLTLALQLYIKKLQRYTNNNSIAILS